MTAAFGIGAGVGLALGIGHAWVLWKASQPPFRWAGGALLRILPVAAVFIIAAFLGGIIPVAIGWAVGFPVSVAAIAFKGST